MKSHSKGVIYACITAFFWGFLAIALKVAVRKIDPVTIVWFRFIVAFLLLATWQVIKNPSSFQLMIKPPPLLILAALGLTWNYLGYMQGIHYTTPSNAQLFIQTGPIMLAVAGFLFFKEKMTGRQVIGFGFALIGLAFFYRDQLSAFIESQGKYNQGVLFTISGALAWATYAISQKKLVSSHPVEKLNLFLFGLPAIIYLPFVDFSILADLSFGWWMLLLFLGANTFIAYTCLAMALKYTEANKVSVIIIVNPIITFITMGLITEFNVSWVEHERFSPITILGALLVITGAILVALKASRKQKIK